MNVFKRLIEKNKYIYWQKNLPYEIPRIALFAQQEMIDKGIIKIKESVNIYDYVISSIPKPVVISGKKLIELCLTYSFFVKLRPGRGLGRSYIYYDDYLE